MKKSFLISGLVVAVLFSACKSDNTPEPAPVDADSTAHRIQKKWLVDTIIDVTTNGTTIDSFIMGGNNTDYLYFKADGKVYSFTGGEYDTSTYTIIGNDSLELFDTKFRITYLTETNFNLYNHSEQAGETDEIFIRFKR